MNDNEPMDGVGQPMSVKEFGEIMIDAMRRKSGNPSAYAIKELMPSSSRLLLAMITSNGSESEDSMIMRAGIKTYDTYDRSLAQLKALGFLVKNEEDGKWYVQLREFSG